jgi:regulator of cell morphogenesis and NO signaling
MKKEFLQLIEQNWNLLSQFVPIVTRVHGKEHPEFLEVKKEFDLMNEKINNKNYNDLKVNFDNLKNITNNYLVPSDVCETYEACYKMLEKLNNNY